MADAHELSCDVAVIGAGTAGLAATRRALREGAKVLLIDDAFVGTMCANVGCMPSKLLIAASKAAVSAREAGLFGVHAENLKIDGAAVMARVRAERDRFTAKTREGFDDLPPGTMIKARAKFSSATTLELDDGRSVTAKAIVIATGGKPKIPDSLSELGDVCLTHETVFELFELPASIAVIGGGPIGLELAQAFAGLGVRTCLFDEAKTLGGVKDAKLQEIIRSTIGKTVALHLGVKTKATRQGNVARVEWSGSSAGAETFDRVLVATGRPPQLKGLDLEKTGLECDEDGTPLYDRETLQCGDSAIFIAGDANADAPVLHEASSEGMIAGRNAATFPEVTHTRRMTPFSMIFSQPVLATIGAKPDDATLVGKSSYADQGRARVDGNAVGEVHIYAEPTRGRIVGAVLFCPGAEHIAHLLVQTISHGTTASQMLAQPFYHPTLEEGLKTALRQICAEIPASPDYDRLDAPGG